MELKIFLMGIMILFIGLSGFFISCVGMGGLTKGDKEPAMAEVEEEPAEGRSEISVELNTMIWPSRRESS